ncbi:elongation factor P maturation arginine rhamnosyltransferase EarP [Spongiibacter sp. KMU-158]|uniref:Protein-arginine rhamnosyltransferase n=1 Tax=Spongiibacter pelagi TaxID=2760804 RepID=A0A927GWU9_9GAMM|nr:elongation factor P maturation arginine rhamnosyltransferase EarP [Spongiibacter pelagi]
MPPRWDIFCCVVDNFGDIGICWRLARQLANEYSLAIRLWVDKPEAFLAICPSVTFLNEQAQFENVAIHTWPEHWPQTTAEQTADVVIEAFGCDLPATYLKAMSEREQAPLWLNLEYLSAEDWVESCHLLPSPQTNGLKKTFFFPGFTDKTGGLLREENLIEQRRRFQSKGGAKQQFLASLGVHQTNQAVLVSLFTYPNTALPLWLDELANGTQRCHLLIPQGLISQAVAKYLAQQKLNVGERYQKGQLCIQAIPFISQQEYDQLLWSCELNLVRGEDSFVRAQWAGQPMLWHIYPQAEAAHLIKLEAFLSHYTRTMTAENAAQYRSISMAWNSAEAPPHKGWLEFLLSATNRAHASNWCTDLSQQKNLAESLWRFYRNWL